MKPIRRYLLRAVGLLALVLILAALLLPAGNGLAQLTSAQQHRQQNHSVPSFATPTHAVSQTERTAPDPTAPANPYRPTSATVHPSGYGTGQPPYDQPTYDQPLNQQPAYGRHQAGRTHYGRTHYGRTGYGQTHYGQPPYERTQTSAISAAQPQYTVQPRHTTHQQNSAGSQRQTFAAQQPIPAGSYDTPEMRAFLERQARLAIEGRRQTSSSAMPNGQRVGQSTGRPGMPRPDQSPAFGPAGSVSHGTQHQATGLPSQSGVAVQTQFHSIPQRDMSAASAMPATNAQQRVFPPGPAPSTRSLPLAADWWDPVVRHQLRLNATPVIIGLDDLLVRALNHSAQVRVFSELPLIRATSITEADSAFDWYAFIDSRWDDTSDPVGNELTTGGPDRYIDNNFSHDVGIRRRTHNGGQIEFGQRLGWQQTNSRFFVPPRQGTSRLTVSYTHPFLRGSGRVYNESLTVLARIDTGIASDEMSRQLQSHLLEVIRAYWGLYLERGLYVQKLKSYERASDILKRLKQRQAIDAFESQVISAEAEVENRRSDLRRAQAAVRNSEARIRSLVNDPSLGDFSSAELIPTNSPRQHGSDLGMTESMALAVQNRPEVKQSVKQIKAACIRLDMSKNELLPVLNLITEAYVAGLEDNGATTQAVPRQFDTGRPSYSIGLQVEVPLENRAARARRLRRQLELRQLQSQYRTTLETLELEVEVAVREVDTSKTELSAKKSAMVAMRAKQDYIEKRWLLLPGENKSSSFVLEDLLTAQSRLAQAEANYLQSIVTYNLAGMNVQRATGMLLQQEGVTTGSGRMDGLPLLIHDKARVQTHPDSIETYGPSMPQPYMRTMPSTPPAPAPGTTPGAELPRPLPKSNNPGSVPGTGTTPYEAPRPNQPTQPDTTVPGSGNRFPPAPEPNTPSPSTGSGNRFPPLPDNSGVYAPDSVPGTKLERPTPGPSVPLPGSLPGPAPAPETQSNPAPLPSVPQTRSVPTRTVSNPYTSRQSAPSTARPLLQQSDRQLNDSPRVRRFEIGTSPTAGPALYGGGPVR